MKRFAFALAALGLLLVGSQAYANEPFRAVKSHQGSATTSALTLPAFSAGDRNKFQSGIDGIYVVTTAAGHVAVTITPFATGASNPVFVPANTPVFFRASGAEVVTIRLESGSGTVYVTEIDQ